VGRGAIDFVVGAREDRAESDAWLAFSDATDRTMILPLGPARAPIGPPSPEDSLEDARVLFSVGGGAGADKPRITAAFPESEGALFRDVTCGK
jgi:hypothetical protein